jgi:hypothetical protein
MSSEMKQNKTHGFWLILILLGYGLISIYFGQDTDGDFFNYHYYNGYAFLHARLGWDIVPAKIQGFFNPFMDVFNYLIIHAIPSPRLVAFVFGMLSGFAAYFLFKIINFLLADCPKTYRRFYFIIAILLGLTAPTAISQIGSPMNDAQNASIVMLSLFLIVRAVQTSNSRTIFYLLFGGLFFGIAAGLKLTSAIYVLAAFLALLFTSGCFKKNLLNACWLGLGALIGFLVVDAWWAWQLYHNYANPFFPLFNNIFKSPDYWQVSARDQGYGAHGIVQAVIYPYYLMAKTRLVSEPLLRDWRLAAVMTLALFALAKYMLKQTAADRLSLGFTSAWRFISTFFMASYFAWVFEFGIYRYAIPIELLSGVLIVGLYHYVFPENKVKKWVLFILTVVILATTVYPNFGHRPFSKQYVSVESPKIADNAIVLLSGPNQSYVIPFFSASTRFIDPTFLTFDKNALGAKVILEHRGAIYVLITQTSQWQPAVLKDKFGLIPTGNCGYYATSMPGTQKISLCPMQRIQ